MKPTKTTSVGLSIYGQCVLGLRKAEQYLWKNLAWTVSNVDWFCFWSNPFLVGLAVGPLPSGAVNIIKHKKTVIQCFGKETIQAKESYIGEKMHSESIGQPQRRGVSFKTWKCNITKDKIVVCIGGAHLQNTCTVQNTNTVKWGSRE